MTLNDIKKLREEAATLATEARNVLDSITEKTTPEEAAEIEGRFDQMMADYDAKMAKAEREEKLLKAEERLSKGVHGNPQSGQQIEGKTPEDDKPTYRQAFENLFRACGDLSEVSPEERALLKQQYRAQSTTDAAGGYTIPEGFSGEVDKAMAVWGPMWDADIVREYNTTSGNRIPWPTVDDTANTGRIKAENAAADDDGSDDVTFGEAQLDAYVFNTGIVRVSMEIMQDSAFNMESLIEELFGERLGRTANSILTTGTGSSQPRGIVTASSLGHTAASATAITADEIIDLFHSVDPAYRQSPRCRFQFNDSTLATIRKLKDGQGNYLWSLGDIRINEPSNILGRPYSINQAMAGIATGNRSIIFGDHSRYVVRKVIGFQTMILRERYAENFQVGLIGYKRFDGELLNTNAVKHLVQA